MSGVPQDPSFDSSLAFLRDGYQFVSRRCRQLGSDAFETRLLLRPVVCAQGEEAARMFYQADRFTRSGAIPLTAVLLLQDFGSVQTLSGAAHRRRKQMFVQIASPERVRQLGDRVAYHFGAQLARWERQPSIVLQREVEHLLCAATLDWAGIPATQQQIAARTRELSAMVEGAGAIGPRNWKAIYLRSRTEQWAQQVIASIRSGKLSVEENSPAAIIAWHRDETGELLAASVAAVELLNVLRPILAVARYITFAAHALYLNPRCRHSIEQSDEYLRAFVQEVRRFYPFFPAVGGIVQQPFDWHGRHFAKGTWVLFDIYGTNHDERLWPQANSFRPERFLQRSPTAFDLVPQGAGDLATTHRCPGEGIALEITSILVRLLIAFVDYRVPLQDLRISLSRMPALPASGMILEHIHRRPASLPQRQYALRL